MKLEFKYLAPYSAYELKVLRNGDTISRFDWGSEIVTRSDGHILNIKPILRPLSDLNKVIEIEFDNPSFKDYHIFQNFFNDDCLDLDELLNDNVKIEYLPYGAIQWLLENHFDVFGLIEKGLAIDINTL